LDKSVDLVLLKDVFSQFGPIFSCKVATDENGVSRCYGFVHFEKVEDSEKALEAGQNDKEKLKRLGEGVSVQKYLAKQDRPNQPSQHYTNLYVKNIGAKFTTDDLKKLFGEFGDITSPVVMMDAQGNSRCFGFVNFKTHEDAEKASKALDDKALKWKDGVLIGPVAEGETEEELKKEGIELMKLYVKRAMKKEERERMMANERNLREANAPKTNLYIQRLADDVTDDDLRNLFKEFGVIKSARVMRTSTGFSRGFGFCDFASSESAVAAIQKMNNHIFHGKPLYVAYHQRKAERHQMLEMQNSGSRVYPNMPYMRQPQMFSPQMYMTPQMYPANMYATQQYNMRQTYSRQPQFQRYHNARPTRRPNKAQAQPMQQAPSMQQAQAQPLQQTQPVQPAAPVQEPQPQVIRPDENNEKQQIGEQIYTHIMSMFADQEALWGKLTGMLLESIDLNELREILKNTAALEEKITQAKLYYDEHAQAQ